MEKEGWGWATNVVHDVSPLSQVTTDDSLCKVIAKIDIMDINMAKYVADVIPGL